MEELLEDDHNGIVDRGPDPAGRVASMGRTHVSGHAVLRGVWESGTRGFDREEGELEGVQGDYGSERGSAVHCAAVYTGEYVAAEHGRAILRWVHEP